MNTNSIYSPTIKWFFLELTNSCNSQCSYCPSKMMTRKRSFMSFEMAKNILGKISKYKEDFPEYNGYTKMIRPIFLHIMGEPLLHPKLFEIIRYGHTKKMEFSLVTNGTLLNTSIIKKMIESKLSFVTLSINTANERKFRIDRPGFSYNDYILKIREFIKANIFSKISRTKIELQYLVNKKNMLDARHGLNLNPDKAINIIQEWCKYLYKVGVYNEDQSRSHPKTPKNSVYGIDNAENEGFGIGSNHYRHIDIAELSSFFNADNDKIEYRVEIAKNVFVLFKAACNFANAISSKKLNVVKSQYGSCAYGCPFTQLCIFSNGETSFCSIDYENTLSLGNVYETSIANIWNFSKIVSTRKAMVKKRLISQICQKCNSK